MPGIDDVHYMTAEDAAKVLRVKKQTLYAYVSRGWIRRQRQGDDGPVMYLREDVERMGSRSRARAEGGPSKGGSHQPHWSEPIIQTAITEITPRGPIYRGFAAVDLAAGGERFENLAEMLWTGVRSEEPESWPPEPLPVLAAHLFRELGGSMEPIQYFGVAVSLLAAAGDLRHDTRHGTTIADARAALSLFAGCLGYLGPEAGFVMGREGETLAAHLLRAVGAQANPVRERALNAALVLLADHHLTPQAVAVRLAASSGASLPHCLNAALSVHSNSRSRRVYRRIEDLLLEAPDEAGFLARIEESLRSSGRAPGFFHRMYPQGDPRVAPLLSLAAGAQPTRGRRPDWIGYLAAVRARTGMAPTAEAALTVLCHGLGLPRRSPGAIYALARTAGWIAHAIEQRMAGVMLRPRARYLG